MMKTEYNLSKLDGDILLIGGYGAGNIGDEAILTGLLGQLSNNVNSVSVTSHDTKETWELHNSELSKSTHLNPISPTPSTLLSQLICTDHIVVGGGGIFSNYMGDYAKKIPYYTLLALMMQKKVHWTALGVYPSTPTSVRIPLKYCMKHSNTITVRDPVSKGYLESIGVHDVKLVPDPARLISPDNESATDLLKEVGLEPDDKIVGIAARHVLDENLDERLQESYQDTAAHLQDSGYKVIFLPFCQHPTKAVENDFEICKEYVEMLGTPKIPNFVHPRQLLAIISQIDLMIATRLHSMIFAQTVNTPFVCVEYAEKCRSLLEHYDETESGVQLETVSSDEILSRIPNIE